MLRRILLGLLTVFVTIQWFQPEKNLGGVSDNDIARKFDVPNKIATKLQASCYDCHSNNTKYPWYTMIQPVGWIMARHVKEGKSGLNFSEFATYSPSKAAHKLEELSELVLSEAMPIKSYLIAHNEAKLTSEERKEIGDWATVLRQSILTAHGLEDED